MNKLSKALLLLALPLTTFCSEPARIQGFDSDSWKADKGGCEKRRAALVPEFETIRKELYGRTEGDIKDILGRPDAEELMSRGQRTFIYYLEPGMQCLKGGSLSDANRAHVRFNALNKVSEVTYLRPVSKQKSPAN